jgi:hypothetical protein
VWYTNNNILREMLGETIIKKKKKKRSYTLYGWHEWPHTPMASIITIIIVVELLEMLVLFNNHTNIHYNLLTALRLYKKTVYDNTRIFVSVCVCVMYKKYIIIFSITVF